ncbi:hypothetical protein AAVH_16424 [Aphelenchoides avenae]|nr:hypothetical protein AAVH_16424 [Aphelenchus avenae]
MSSIQTAPVELLLDMFQANEPAGKEALQLTCRRFHDIILQNVDALPTRLVCALALDHLRRQVRLYRAPQGPSGDLGADREIIASSSWQRHEIQHLYKMFGRKTAIRTVEISVPRLSELDGFLTQLIEHFPSVKGAAKLRVDTARPTYPLWDASAGLPTDPVLDNFERLETILMFVHVHDKHPSFWSHLFATKAFRRVSNFLMENSLGQFPAVDDGELFNFITDFSCMPANKPRLVLIFGLNVDSVDALERRFKENIDSIGGQVCAALKDPERRILTNMAVGSQKKITIAGQLILSA